MYRIFLSLINSAEWPTTGPTFYSRNNCARRFVLKSHIFTATCPISPSYTLHLILFLCSAAFAAGLAVGVWRDISEIQATWKRRAQYLPSMDDLQQKKLVCQCRPSGNNIYKLSR